MKFISYIFIRLLVFIFSILPFRVLYLFSDFIKWVLKDLIKYRTHVVEDQLRKCFPHMSDQEIENIKDENYRNLADLVVESIKGFSMSEDALKTRWKLINAEKIEAGLVQQGRNADEKEPTNVFLGENLARGFKLMTKVAALAAAQES